MGVSIGNWGVTTFKDGNIYYRVLLTGCCGGGSLFAIEGVTTFNIFMEVSVGCLIISGGAESFFISLLVPLLRGSKKSNCSVMCTCDKEWYSKRRYHYTFVSVHEHIG